MQLRTLNPLTGLRQISNGYVCFPRKICLTAIRVKQLKPNQLGYFFMLLCSADWDTDPYRHGYIRHSIASLAKIWGIPYATLRGQIVDLLGTGIIKKENDFLKIVKFDRFTFSGASTYAKSKMNDEEIVAYFGDILSNNEKSLANSRSKSDSFRDSFKNVSSRSSGNKSISNDDTELSDKDIEWINNNIEEKGGGLSLI